MKKKININKVSKSISSVFNKDSAKLNIRPYVDWWFIVVLFFVLTFVVSIFSYSTFIDIYSKDVYTLDELIPTNQYGQDDDDDFREDLARLLQFYDTKQTRLDNMLRQGVPKVNDPSYVYWVEEDLISTEFGILIQESIDKEQDKEQDKVE